MAILSRGYKSKQESKARNLKNFFGLKNKSPKVVSDGKEVFLNSEDAGDEASCSLATFRELSYLQIKTGLRQQICSRGIWRRHRYIR